MFQGEQGIVGVGQHPEDFVELALGGGLMAGLGVLDDEHHGHGDRRDQRLEDLLPAARKVEDHTEQDPQRRGGQHADGGQGPAGPAVDLPQQPAPP
jgi:hypothetical protein